jgi:hypothetical protein
MFKENQNTTEAIIELIRTLPVEEQLKIKDTLYSKKTNNQTQHNEDKEYQKNLKRFNTFVSQHRVELPVGFKFNREDEHHRG